MNGLLLLAVVLAGLVAVQAGKGHLGGYGYGNRGYGYNGYNSLGYGHVNGLYNVGNNGLYNGWHGGLNNGWYGDDDYNNYWRPYGNIYNNHYGYNPWQYNHGLWNGYPSVWGQHGGHYQTGGYNSGLGYRRSSVY